jgi:hypothetical protein
VLQAPEAHILLHVITMTMLCAHGTCTHSLLAMRMFGHTSYVLNKKLSTSVGVGDLRVSQALGLVIVLVLATL